MKRKKIHKYLSLLLITVCAVLFISSMTVVALETDENMKVIARIEDDSTENTHPVIDNSNSTEQNSNSTSLEKIVLIFVIVFLILIIILLIIIYFNRKKDKTNSINTKK